jgi:hypothetical protein
LKVETVGVRYRQGPERFTYTLEIELSPIEHDQIFLYNEAESGEQAEVEQRLFKGLMEADEWFNRVGQGLDMLDEG